MKKRYSSIFMLVMVISGFCGNLSFTNLFYHKKEAEATVSSRLSFLFFGLFCYSPFFFLYK